MGKAFINGQLSSLEHTIVISHISLFTNPWRTAQILLKSAIHRRILRATEDSRVIICIAVVIITVMYLSRQE